jgi:hypothetical protein
MKVADSDIWAEETVRVGPASPSVPRILARGYAFHSLLSNTRTICCQ